MCWLKTIPPMTKLFFIPLTIFLFARCEFMNEASEFKENITSHKLFTHTMEPRNSFEKKYSIDHKNKDPKRFDIIEFQFDDEYFDVDDFYSSNQHVSRVIGMPGESIEVRKGKVYINDTLLDPPFLIDSCSSWDDYPKTSINDKSYFVMVDNRKAIHLDSIKSVEFKPYDSRKIGSIHQSRIVGITDLK